MNQIDRAFLRGREVVIAGLIDPEPMRLEVGGDGQVRRVDFLLVPECGDHFRRQEVRVDDDIPTPAPQEPEELPKVELFDHVTEPVALLSGRGFAVHQVVEVAQHVRRPVHQVQVGLGVERAGRLRW